VHPPWASLPAPALGLSPCRCAAPASSELLAACAWDGTVRIWSVCAAASAPLARRGGAAHVATYSHEMAALAAAFAPQGGILFSGGADAAVRSFELSTGGLSAVGSHGGPVVAVATAEPHPSMVLSASLDKTVAVWDPRASSGAGAKPASTVALPERALCLDLRWPHALVGTGAAAAGAQLIDLRYAPAEAKPLKLHQSVSRFPPRSVALFPGGEGFCAGSHDGRVAVHFHSSSAGGAAGAAAAAPKAKAPWGEDFSFKCHRQGADKDRIYGVGALSFFPAKPHLLATAGSDGECHLWDLKRRHKTAHLLKASTAGSGAPVALPAIAFSRGGDMLAYARSDDWSGGAAAYEATRGAGHANDVRILLLDPSGWEKREAG